MPETNLFDSLFSDDDDGEFAEDFIVTSTFKAQFKGTCTIDETHSYRAGDIVGKVERTDNPFLPVSGVCCNKCVRSLTHKKSLG